MKKSRFGELGLIVANSVPSWGQNVSKILKVKPMEIFSDLFENQELKVSRGCDVSGRDICVLTSLHSHYDTMSELKLICDSINGASRIFAVFPFVRNGKSDHKKSFGENVAYKVTAMDISSSGLEVIAIFDQHSSQHPSFYDTRHYRLRKVHHVYLMKILIEHAMKMKDSFDSVLALDDGGFKRNKKIAELLGKNVSFIIKERDTNTREIHIGKSKIVGDVSGQRVFSFDDMLQNGGTLEAGARIAKYNGAKEISFFVVHNDFSNATFNRINPLLENGLIDKIYTLETIPLRRKDEWHKNLVVISPEELIANVIKTIHLEGHMRDHFLEI